MTQNQRSSVVEVRQKAQGNRHGALNRMLDELDDD